MILKLFTSTNHDRSFVDSRKVGVAVLLDVEDLVRMKKPEPRSIQTQVQMIFSKYRPKDMDLSQLTIAWSDEGG